MKNIPNILSLLRILLSVSLLFLTNNSLIFLIIYCLAGISDMLDGYLARRFHWQSRLGQQLDSLGDFIFFTIIAYLLIIRTTFFHDYWFLIFIVVVIRIINFLITWIRFHKIGMLHSWGNKLTGLLLFLYTPFILVVKISFSWLPLLVGFIAVSSALEESLIILRAEDYDADQRSIFF